MSSIPNTKKTKYNHNDAFRWVDSQWEKFMTEQKELKALNKQLQEDLVTCNKHFHRQREELIGTQEKLNDLVERVPSRYLTEQNTRDDKWRIEQFNRHRDVEDQVSTIEEMEEKVKEIFETKYIYESPDGGKTLYRREFGDYDSPRVQVDKDGNPLSVQLELFEND